MKRTWLINCDPCFNSQSWIPGLPMVELSSRSKVKSSTDAMYLTDGIHSKHQYSNEYR